MTMIAKKCLIALVSLAACTLAVDASAAKPKKQESTPLAKPDESTAVVSFIRRSVLMGDGWNYDIWDGDKYVGVLGAGNLVQYRAAPGEHTFLLMGRGIHVWAFMKANLVAGKEYFARAYPSPFSLQPTDAHTDERVDEWLTMKVDAPVSEAKKSKWVAKTLPEAQGALAAFNAGEVATDCALWFPPNSKGEKHAPPSRSAGMCRSLGEMKPEFGR